MWFEEFQDDHYDSYLGFLNRTVLAILILHVAPMPLTKFGLNPIQLLGADVV